MLSSNCALSDSGDILPQLGPERTAIFAPRDRAQSHTHEGSMRRPVRPFVKEFKTRSSTGRTTLTPAQAASAELASPSIWQVFDAAPPALDPSQDYEAALRAADALFGSAAPQPAQSAPAPVAGRILPSLIEVEPQPERDEEIEIETPRRRGRPPGRARALDPTPSRTTREVPKAEGPKAEVSKAEGPKAAGPEEATKLVAKAPSREPRAVARSVAPTPSADDQQPELAGGRREKSRLQQRWVIGNSAAPGAKWRRRLRFSSR